MYIEGPVTRGGVLIYFLAGDGCVTMLLFASEGSAESEEILVERCWI